MNWDLMDTWVVVTAACIGMACALPGVYLMLRRQSMLGDGISHAVLPGLAIAFIATGSRSSVAMLVGAAVAGLLTVVLTQLVQRLGRVEGGAALGVVFTSLFALGLVLIRIGADHVDLDPDCVLYGSIELAVIDFENPVPRVTMVAAGLLVVNLLLTVLFYKELKLASFDPAMATAQGIPAWMMNYGIMVVTAVTTVIAFESVGSVLVIAMLIVPPAAAHMLTDRMSVVIVWSLVLAVVGAVLGHVLAGALPTWIFVHMLDMPQITDVSTAGMICVVLGGLFVLAVFFGPRHGVVSRLRHRLALNQRIIAEDVMGMLYRIEELPETTQALLSPARMAQALRVSRLELRLALRKLLRQRLITRDGGLFHLTDTGRDRARDLVRTHRLWEAYLAQHMAIPLDHLHHPAERLEHVTSPAMQQELTTATDDPGTDPHGRQIPP